MEQDGSQVQRRELGGHDETKVRDPKKSNVVRRVDKTLLAKRKSGRLRWEKGRNGVRRAFQYPVQVKTAIIS